MSDECDAPQQTSGNSVKKEVLQRITPVIAGLALCLVIVIIVKLVVNWRQDLTQSNEIGRETMLLKASLQDTQQTVAALSRRLTEQTAKQQQSLQDIMTQLHQQKNKSQDWLVEEAFYLIELANFNLQFENNTAASLKLLQRAAENLQQTLEPSLVNLNAAVNDDIAALQRVAFIDKEKIYVQLTTIDHQLDGLIPHANINQAIESAQTTNNAPPPLNFKNNLEKLSNLISIRHHDQLPPTALSVQNISALYQNLHLSVATAKFALLQNQSEIFRQAINELSQWINGNFVSDDAMTLQTLALLEQLKHTTIRPNVPALQSPHLINRRGTTQGQNTPPNAPSDATKLPVTPAIAL